MGRNRRRQPARAQSEQAEQQTGEEDVHQGKRRPRAADHMEGRECGGGDQQAGDASPATDEGGLQPFAKVDLLRCRLEEDGEAKDYRRTKPKSKKGIGK